MKKKYNSTCCFLFLLICNSLYSQGTPDLEYTSTKKDTIIIKELLVLNKDNEYVPFKWPAKKFFNDENNGGVTRGIRFFNFGCFQSPKDIWQGQIGKDATHHVKFKTPVWGIRGLIKIIIKKHKRGVNTLENFFKEYAPSSDCIGSLPRLPDGTCPRGENDPLAYAKHMAKVIGIKTDEKFEYKNEDGTISIDFIQKFVSGVASMELPFKEYRIFSIPTDAIQKALDLIK